MVYSKDAWIADKLEQEWVRGHCSPCFLRQFHNLELRKLQKEVVIWGTKDWMAGQIRRVESSQLKHFTQFCR